MVPDLGPCGPTWARGRAGERADRLITLFEFHTYYILFALRQVDIGKMAPGMVNPIQPILDSLITLNSECMSGKICVQAARERAEKLLVVAQRTQKAVTPFLKTLSETIPAQEK